LARVVGAKKAETEVIPSDRSQPNVYKLTNTVKFGGRGCP